MPASHLLNLFFSPAFSVTQNNVLTCPSIAPLPTQALPAFIEKAIQLYEMVVVRHGLMLVGQSFGMKTSSIRVLAAALGDMNAAGMRSGVWRRKEVGGGRDEFLLQPWGHECSR